MVLSECDASHIGDCNDQLWRENEFIMSWIWAGYGREEMLGNPHQ